MLPFVSRRRYEAELDQLHALEVNARKTALLSAQATIDHLTQANGRLQSALSAYAGTLDAQDGTVRLHLARIEFLQRSLTDATTTTTAWAEDRKEQAAVIADLKLSLIKALQRQDLAEAKEREALRALGMSRARYGDLEARLTPADAENVGLVQARIRRLIEALWASRRRHQHAEEGSLCGVFGHVRGSWEDDAAGIWYCPDCGDEIWLNS